MQKEDKWFLWGFFWGIIAGAGGILLSLLYSL